MFYSTAANPLDQTRSRAYTAGLLIQTTDARGNSSNIQYDAQGRPTQVTDALGNPTVTTYDPAGLGRVVSERNARGHLTSYSHDANGNVLTITDAAGGLTTHSYDANDNLTSTTDPRGNTTTYVYDILNRKIEERYSVGGQQRVRSFTYDALGRVQRVTNELNNSSESRFDARGKVLKQIDPLAQSVTYSYDANGNVLTETDAFGRRITYQYDALDRKTRATDALGNYEEYIYNTAGQLASKRDGRGKLTSYEYDALGRMTKVTDADNGVTIASYDANGNLASTTDRKHQATIYSYDKLNRLTQLSDPLSRKWSFTYDANGNLLTRATPAGQTTSYTYDNLDRVTQVVYPGGPNVSYTYDANGNRRTMSDGNGTTRYSYDEQDRLTGVTDAFGNAVAYRYDSAGQLDRLTYPGSKAVNYAYDAVGRLLSLTDWLNHTTRYTRDSSGAVTAIQYGNGAKVEKSYDAAGRLVSLFNRNAANTVISSHSLTLDGVGNPTSASLDLPLLPTNLGKAAEMLYDASNRLTTVGGKTVSHDSDGRITADASGTDPIQYAYNAQDLINSVTTGGVLTDSYTYDGDGRRVARTSGTTTTRYVLDPTGGDLYSVLAETNASNSVLRYYLYGEGLVSQISGSSHRYYHFDQTGNTLALTDDSGVVTDSYAYEPFGNTTAQGSSVNPFRFVGQYGVMDDGNGLNHMRARYYRPDVRRFVSLDALYGEVGDSMALNRYQYVNGNPIARIDHTGFNAYSTCNEYTKNFCQVFGQSTEELVQHIYQMGAGLDYMFLEMFDFTGISDDMQVALLSDMIEIGFEDFGYNFTREEYIQWAKAADESIDTVLVVKQLSKMVKNVNKIKTSDLKKYSIITTSKKGKIKLDVDNIKQLKKGLVKDVAKLKDVLKKLEAKKSIVKNIAILEKIYDSTDAMVHNELTILGAYQESLDY